MIYMADKELGAQLGLFQPEPWPLQRPGFFIGENATVSIVVMSTGKTLYVGFPLGVIPDSLRRIKNCLTK
jgi:hypothetical protein